MTTLDTFLILPRNAGKETFLINDVFKRNGFKNFEIHFDHTFKTVNIYHLIGTKPDMFVFVDPVDENKLRCHGCADEARFDIEERLGLL